MLHLPTLLLASWACSIAYFDARYRRIPNVLSLGAWVFAVALLIARQASLVGAPVTDALEAAAFAMLVTLPGYVVKKLGAGDVKFLVAIGLLTSLDITLRCFVMAAFGGALVSMLWLTLPRIQPHLNPAFIQSHASLARWLAMPLHDRRMPYGVLLAAGLVLALWTEVGL